MIDLIPLSTVVVLSFINSDNPISVFEKWYIPKDVIFDNDHHICEYQQFQAQHLNIKILSQFQSASHD